jgi:hypothetical protein
MRSGSRLVSLLVVAGVASAFHVPRPAFRCSRGAQRPLVLRIEQSGSGPEQPPPSPQQRDNERTRRTLIDAAVFAGLAFYLGGLFGQMTNSQFVVALQSLRFDTEHKGTADPVVQRRDPPPVLAQPPAHAANRQAVEALPLQTIAINSGIMYLLGVICSPTVTPLIDHARAKLDKAGEAKPHFFFHPVRWWRAQRIAQNQVETMDISITRDESYSVTISHKPVSPAPAETDALGILGSNDSLSPGGAEAIGVEMSTTISLPDRFRVLALPQAGQSSGTFQLPGGVYFTPRRQLSLSMPMLLPRELTMLALLLTFALISAAWPCVGLVAVQFTLSRS